MIQDWNSGHIPFYTVPPAHGIAVETHVESAIVSGFSEAFSLEGFGDDAEVLAGAADGEGMMCVEGLGPAGDVDLGMDVEEPHIEEEMDTGMEVDAPVPAPVPMTEIRFKSKPVIKKTEFVEKEIIFSAAELVINPQHAKNVKSMAKKNRKDARRAQKSTTMDME